MNRGLYFLYIPIPWDDESLTSYIQRISNANYLKPYEIWRSLVPPGKRYPRLGMEPLMEYSPASVIDMDNLARLLNLDVQILKNLTFYTVLTKIYNSEVDEGLLMRNGFFSRYVTYHRRFCPICLREKNYYKRIWQVKEIKICIVHNAKLIDTCPKCSKHMSLLGTNAVVGKCDNCGFLLGKCEVKVIEPFESELTIYKNWLFLLCSEEKHDRYGSLMNDFAIRLLYKNETSELFKEKYSNFLLTGLYQSLCRDREIQGFEYLNFIIGISKVLGITLKDLFNINVPKDYLRFHLF